jgi:hypothetical protein
VGGAAILAISLFQFREVPVPQQPFPGNGVQSQRGVSPVSVSTRAQEIIINDSHEARMEHANKMKGQSTEIPVTANPIRNVPRETGSSSSGPSVAAPKYPAGNSNTPLPKGNMNASTKPDSAPPFSVNLGADGMTEEIEIASGVELPAVLADQEPGGSDAPTTQQAAEAADRLGNDFFDAVGATTNAPAVSQPEWQMTVDEADERYVSLFGVESFKEMKTRLAREALAAGR